MNEPEHHRLRMALGAYVLGHLDAEESREVEAHLETCAACRGELDDLLPAAAALADVRRVDLPAERASAVSGTPSPSPSPPPGLGDRVLAAVADDRREARRSWLRSAGVAAVAGAAAAAVLVVGLAVTGTETTDAPSVPLEAVAVDVRRPGIVADAALVNHTWGVEVKLEGSGFTEGRRYQVMILGRDGTRHSAGEFVGTGAAEMACNLSSAVLRDRAAGFEVRDDRGIVVRSEFA